MNKKEWKDYFLKKWHGTRQTGPDDLCGYEYDRITRKMMNRARTWDQIADAAYRAGSSWYDAAANRCKPSEV